MFASIPIVSSLDVVVDDTDLMVCVTYGEEREPLSTLDKVLLLESCEVLANRMGVALNVYHLGDNDGEE